MTDGQPQADQQPHAEQVETRRDLIERLLDEERLADAVEALLALHPADQAEALRDIAPIVRETVVAELTAETLAHIVEQLDGKDRGRLVDQIAPSELAHVLNRTDSDIAADVLRHIDPYVASRVLSQMIPANSARVMPLLVHEDESAGGRMTSGYISLLREMSADEAITYLRLLKPDAQEVYYLYVLDTEGTLEGVVSLRDLITAPPDALVADIMNPEVISVPPDVDQEEAGRLLSRYDLLSLPVVGDRGRLLGIITSDDLMDVLEAEATEDMYRMVGIGGREGLRATLTESLQRRLPWLTINIVTAFLAALIVAGFESTVDRVAAIAVFMPVIAGQGGNAGMQTLTLVVRGLALDETAARRTNTLLRRELFLGLLNGLVLGLVAAAGALVLSGGNALLATIVGVAMALNLLAAAAAGVLVPVGLRALRADPALASSIFVTTVTDACGFLLLLSMATVFVSQLD